MNIIKIILFVFGAVILTAILLYIALYASFIYAVLRSRTNRKIARDVLISSDWVEIMPRPPLRSKKLAQHVVLIMKGYSRDITDTRSQIIFPDGTVVNPEVQVEDEYGNIYSLHPSLRLSSGVGFTRDFDKDSKSRFPQDRVYPKIRIRSDKPFTCSKIIWECYDLVK